MEHTGIIVLDELIADGADSWQLRHAARRRPPVSESRPPGLPGQSQVARQSCSTAERRRR